MKAQVAGAVKEDPVLLSMVCKCGKPARPGFKTCQKCADKAAKDARDRYAKLHPKKNNEQERPSKGPQASAPVIIGAPGKAGLIETLRKEIELRERAKAQLEREIEALRLSESVLSGKSGG